MKESQIQITPLSGEQSEFIDLFLFRELMFTTNKLERMKDGMDKKTEHIIFEGKSEAFEIYRKRFYPDIRLRGVANEIIKQEKDNSGLIRIAYSRELFRMWAKPARESRAIFVERRDKL